MVGKNQLEMIARQTHQDPGTGSITYGSYQRDAGAFSRERERLVGAAATES